jgi:hypothetical protein
MDVVPSDNLPGMTAYLTQKRRAERAAKKEEKALKKEARIVSSATLSINHLPLTETDTRKSHKNLLIEPEHLLRRMPNFKEIVREKFSTQRPHEEARPKKINLEKAKQERIKILEGKLEVVVPPIQKPGSEGRLAPPRPFLDPKSKSKRSSKSSSSSSKVKVVDYLRTSADILDETRREITGKFRLPFEQLSYPLSRRNSKIYASGESNSSEESFFCIGVDTETREEKALKARQKANANRLERDTNPTGLSGKGTDPWVDPPPKYCRLCRKAGISGMQGLCRDCERAFMRHKQVVRESPGSWTSSCHSAEEIKPTPPSKDRETLLLKGNSHEHQPVLCNANNKDLPPIPHEVEIIEPTPQRRSTHALLNNDGSDDERFRRWQSKELKAEFEKSRKQFPVWAQAYENEDYLVYNRGKKEGQTPLVAAGEEPKREGPDERNTNFYKFWDEILPKTPKIGRR